MPYPFSFTKSDKIMLINPHKYQGSLSQYVSAESQKNKEKNNKK
jgi:hypothetical protein